MKCVEIGLPYWKQGDDLRLYLEDCNNDVDAALELHAKSMSQASEILSKIREIVSGHEVSVYACTHSIEMEAADEVIDRLVAAGLADIREYEDEDVVCTEECPAANPTNG